MSYLERLLARLDEWHTPDGLDCEPRRIAHRYVRFSGKLSGNAKKMAHGRTMTATLKSRMKKTDEQ